MGKRPKKLGNRKRKKKKRNSVRNYQESLQLDWYINRGKRDMKRRERRDGKKIGNNGKIPQDKKS